jgi:hypothetical protein
MHADAGIVQPELFPRAPIVYDKMKGSVHTYQELVEFTVCVLAPNLATRHAIDDEESFNFEGNMRAQFAERESTAQVPCARESVYGNAVHGRLADSRLR